MDNLIAKAWVFENNEWVFRELTQTELEKIESLEAEQNKGEGNAE